MALLDPFPTKPTFVTLIPHRPLETKLAALKSDRRFTHLGVAVANLTGSSRDPKAVGGINHVAGWNMNVTRYSASMVKIAAMFAAFQLRERLRTAAAALPAKDVDDLVNKITKEWKPLIKNQAADDFPKLKTIFSIGGSSGAWSFNFSSKFQQNMEDMIGPSSNSGASYCILALGFQYINAALAAEGLYTSGVGGLWLSGDYAAGKDGKAEPKSKSHQAASPEAVIRFLALLETNRLVSVGASAEMRGLMQDNNPDPRYASYYMKRFLHAYGRPFGNATSYGKLGIGDKSAGNRYYDCAVIERTPSSGPNYKYAMVMLGAGFDVLVELGIGIDDLMP